MFHLQWAGTPLNKRLGGGEFVGGDIQELTKELLVLRRQERGWKWTSLDPGMLQGGYGGDELHESELNCNQLIM